MRVEDFDYHLPPELIAQTPLSERSSSRLMVVDPVDQTIVHSTFRHLRQFLNPGDVLVFNNSKVLPARLYGTKQGTGAQVELLLVKETNPFEWIVLAKPAKRLKAGNVIEFEDHGDSADGTPSYAEVVEVLDEGLRKLQFHVNDAMYDFLERAGTMPLPPYIHETLKDQSRYQTVYAQKPGSVAAPTAGLHFTPELLDELRRDGIELHNVTLHVGLGTFRPVQADVVEEHKMHSEVYEVPESVAEAVNRARAEGRRIVAVGTTSLRTLESAGATGKLQAGTGDTDIFIYPGYQFRIIDALITNFHLPKSTLIMLVAALMGLDFTKTVYEQAVAERYRFFSFGDGMLISRRGRQ
ncbi:tRNA preQ1(34) S-adenosylmethionine ribosyltransferase-isomerase QueA [Alicyclobacillus tolerans]|uniref:tRNA preQ1(34) S-adenosylmethionine ribosyltransferase-isomerase QueA n=1 Tax=Alicyclobacillus tolerans TaxID=90970 RepID=UPI001F0307AB|nr:tRNA preQ1(34) S-adenosylmethionine ribosyltransferase-isomerase QueA [Alicyclobacillus tolerans]MCF8565199.1 tRNA preQ1(34) S-adenosylmethionine ribosyltransferase-isomerase QueA [Alicyclobacillus tolerans]